MITPLDVKKLNVTGAALGVAGRPTGIVEN
jgi:hypothetical protein